MHTVIFLFYFVFGKDYVVSVHIYFCAFGVLQDVVINGFFDGHPDQIELYAL